MQTQMSHNALQTLRIESVPILRSVSPHEVRSGLRVENLRRDHTGTYAIHGERFAAVTESAHAHSHLVRQQVQEQGQFWVGCSSLGVNKCLIGTM